MLGDSLEALGIEYYKAGTMVTIEGPRFSSRAESLMFKSWGGQLIGMTTVPEVSYAHCLVLPKLIKF